MFIGVVSVHVVVFILKMAMLKCKLCLVLLSASFTGDEYVSGFYLPQRYKFNVPVSHTMYTHTHTHIHYILYYNYFQVFNAM